jgi:hypothetical protein
MRTYPGFLKAYKGSFVEDCIQITVSWMEQVAEDPSATSKVVVELDRNKYDPSKHYYNVIEANGKTLIIAKDGIEPDIHDDNKLIIKAQQRKYPT